MRIFILVIAALGALIAMAMAVYLALLGWVDGLPYAAQVSAILDDNIRASAAFFWIEVLAIVAGAPIVAMIWNANRAAQARNVLIRTLLSDEGYPVIRDQAIALQRQYNDKKDDQKDDTGSTKIDLGALRHNALFIQRAIQRYENAGGHVSEKIAFHVFQLADTARTVASQVRNMPDEENKDSYRHHMILLGKNTQEMSTRLRQILQARAPRALKKLDA